MKHLVIAACLAATPLAAQDMIQYDTDQSFEDVLFGLENAILNEGLVIDSTSHVGAMLERTRADTGSDVQLYEAADVFSFCSATLSRKVMEADPMNIVYCPYDIFVMVRSDTPGTTTVGFRTFPEGPMKEVEALLDSLAKAAIGME
ncbi:DUF302 domain-containing protein [Aestuariicoccus sp. MJ-SS9]|uniref:DUF302 domain-containing protein n=1 Tax=Aestuariicoccus sp. MJ-SS9 TaxID=3079855 RepID=UPI00290B7764|nr:DUF302 domain-containing protein [Aestuariicoccus sp. MJ-SS9]MDU8910673.1 DUF302 domain-containing protein [Aestuariicoccus sp. MJ-SS9]